MTRVTTLAGSGFMTAWRLAPGDVPDPLNGDALLVSGFSLLQSASAAGGRAALDRFAGRWAR